jgi:hypothetical protein
MFFEEINYNGLMVPRFMPKGKCVFDFWLAEIEFVAQAFSQSSPFLRPKIKSIAEHS